MRIYKITRGRIMTLTTVAVPEPYKTSFYILVPAKGSMSYWQTISSRLYVRLKQVVHSLAQHF